MKSHYIQTWQWYNDEIALEMRFRQRLKGKINGILLVSRTTDHATFNNVEWWMHWFIDVNRPITCYTMMWKLRVLWLVVAHDLMSWETCSLCFVQHGAWFWKCLWDNFGLRKWKPCKKLSRNYSNTKKKNGETETKRVLTTWEHLNCKKSSQQLLSCVIARTDSMLCKMFSSLFCIEQVKTIKNFLKKLYTSKMKKRRSWDEK